MSYYIITSSSNLGNILSTESISPISMYPKRSYGYKFFDSYGNDVVRDFIRLHDETPAPSESEDAAGMVLELDEDTIKHVSITPDGGLWTSETIRITPNRCRFIFYSEEDLNVAFNGVQRSLESKFAERYRARAKVMPVKTSEATLDLRFDPPELPTNSEPVEDTGRYERIDRIKGAIFGYCLGFYYSLPRDSSVRDDFLLYLITVDDMVNSVTQATEEELEGKRAILERILFRFVLYAQARELERTSTDDYDDYRVFDMEKAIGSIRSRACIEPPFDLRNDTFGLNMYRSDLEDRIRKAKDAWKKPTPFRREDRPEVIVSPSGPKLALPEKHGKLANQLINYLVRADVLGVTNRTLGYPFALECGQMIKSRFGESWEDSGERKYINRLLPHLNNMEDFNPNDNCGIEDYGSFEALRYLSLLCERQDNEDLDSFYQYLLIKCRTVDFCLPFALWGAAFGFSVMPKTLCDAMPKSTESVARNLFNSVLATLDK